MYIIQKSEENLVPILPNIVPFHCLLNGSVHNPKILNFEVHAFFFPFCFLFFCPLDNVWLDFFYRINIASTATKFISLDNLWLD